MYAPKSNAGAPSGSAPNVRTKNALYFPESDGEPMAQNPKQWNEIVIVASNLERLYADDENVWIGKDQFWYPLANDPKTSMAPDAFVVWGVEKKYRPTYKQFEEGGIAPQVVFEMLSPSNDRGEMDAKLLLYEKYGVEEYYIVDPDFHLEKSGVGVYLRDQNGRLVPQPFNGQFVSPRMKITLKANKTDKSFSYAYPDGSPFRSINELWALKKEAELKLEQERIKKVAARILMEQERLKKEAAKQKAENYAKLLRSLGIDVDKLE